MLYTAKGWFDDMDIYKCPFCDEFYYEDNECVECSKVKFDSMHILELNKP
eukprot:UN13761